MPQIQLLDGKKISFNKSLNGFELTKKISKSLEKSALIMEVNGELKDLSFEIKRDSKVKIITNKDKIIIIPKSIIGLISDIIKEVKATIVVKTV